ncbi:MAG: mandelate racemase/muconate lactonizing enzyme family protein, partial [Nitrososphaerales archaeon]
GLTGFGEAYWGPGVANMVVELKNLFIGQDPTDPEPVYTKTYRATIPSGGTGGTVTTALSGLEIALWDIYGKAVDLPIYKLLGGKFRDRVLVYADCHTGERGTIEPNDYAEKAVKVKNLGFQALKFDLDFPCYDPFSRKLRPERFNHAVKVVEAIRNAVGDNVELAFDCHWAFSIADGVKLARLMEPYNLMWLEDLIPPENVKAFEKISKKTSTPLCSGENQYTRFGIMPLIEKQAVDVIAPDIPKVGGLTEGKKIADLADMYYILFAPHNVASPLGTVAAVHLCAATPNFLTLEFHSLDVPIWKKMLREGYIIDNGYIEVPERPGLGVELDEKTLKDYAGEEAEKFFS